MGLIGSTCMACDKGILWQTSAPRLCSGCMPAATVIQFKRLDQDVTLAAQCLTSGSVLSELGFQVPDHGSPLKDPAYALAYLVETIRKHGFADPITQKALFQVYEQNRDMRLP